MPTYRFLDNNTGEEFEEIMAMADREPYLTANPHVTQVFNALNIGDSVRLGITKPPAEFMKGVVGRMQESIPGNRLRDTSKFQIPKEI
jgi:hypothetical protein